MFGTIPFGGMAFASLLTPAVADAGSNQPDPPATYLRQIERLTLLIPLGS